MGCEIEEELGARMCYRISKIKGKSSTKRKKSRKTATGNNQQRINIIMKSPNVFLTKVENKINGVFLLSKNLYF